MGTVFDLRAAGSPLCSMLMQFSDNFGKVQPLRILSQSCSSFPWNNCTTPRRI